MNSKQFAPVSCVPQQAVPYALRLGSISDNECPALWDGQYSKSLILEYGEGHQELALNVVEGWALQLYLQSTSTNLSIDIFDPSLGTAFTTLVKLHGIAKTTGLPNGIRLHKYENDYRKIFEELRIEARDRKEFLSNVSDSSEAASWRALLTEDVGAHPLKILLLNSLHVIKDIGQEGAALAELVKFGAALGIVIWVVAETSTLSASSSEYERERDRWRAWFSNDIERHVCKFSLQENASMIFRRKTVTLQWSFRIMHSIHILQFSKILLFRFRSEKKRKILLKAK